MDCVWHKVAQDLPTTEDYVLAWAPNMNIEIVKFPDTRFTHWAPIPPLPKVGVCRYCGGHFILVNNVPKHNNCGSKECKKARLIEVHGGLDGYREWERDNKRRYIAKCRDKSCKA